MDEPTRTMQKVIQDHGPGIGRVQATHWMDMIADEETRERIAQELAEGEKVWWMTPGWLEYRYQVFEGWDQTIANENSPSTRVGPLFWNTEGYLMAQTIDNTPMQLSEMYGNGHDLNFHRFLMNSLPIAVVTVNADFKITGFNPWAEQVTGFSEKEAVGHYCGEILQGGMCKINCPLRAVINKRQTVVRVDTTITDRSKRTIPVQMNTAGLFDDDGRLLGGLEAFQDISYLKALEREKTNLISMFAHDIKIVPDHYRGICSQNVDKEVPA